MHGCRYVTVLVKQKIGQKYGFNKLEGKVVDVQTLGVLQTRETGVDEGFYQELEFTQVESHKVDAGIVIADAGFDELKEVVLGEFDLSTKIVEQMFFCYFRGKTIWTVEEDPRVQLFGGIVDYCEGIHFVYIIWWGIHCNNLISQLSGSVIWSVLRIV